MQDKILYQNQRNLDQPLTTESGLPIDYKRIWAQVQRYWYWIFLSLILTLSIAFLINRYSTRIYPVQTSIYIKEGYEAGGTADILYNNSILNPYRNFYNEIFIIRSYPLVQKVVEELNFIVSFYQEGNIKVSEIYNHLPMKFEILNQHDGSIYDKEFSFKVVSDQKFSLSVYDASNDELAADFEFNDTIRYSGVDLLVKKSDRVNLKPYLNKRYRMKINYLPAIVNFYVRRLNVEWAEEGASVINLAVNGDIPQKEIDFLNTLVKKYSERDLENKVQAAARSLTFIKEQLTDITDSLLNYESRLETFKDNNLGDLSREAERSLEELKQLESSKAELLIRKNYFDYLENYIGEGKNLDKAILPSSVGVSDPILSSLISSMIELQLEAKTLERTENPLRQNVLTRIEDLKQNIRESVKNLVSTDQISLRQIDQKINDAERQLKSLPGAERRLIGIQRNYSLNENLYIYLAQKRYEAGITKASTTSNIEIVNPAMLAGGPVYPKVTKNYLMASFLGLGLPLGILILLELLNYKIQSKEDIQKLTDIPFVGGIGHKRIDSNLVVYEKPRSGLAESFRSLRSNLNYFTGNKQKKIFLVTSSISGEGKSFTTINLATVIAFSGQKTLIIGADMRRPRIYNDFNLTNDFGLSNYLSQTMLFEEIIQPTFIENLDFISAGPVPPNPSELLMRADMDELIQNAQAKYEFIIMDTPPVALVTDAFILSRFANHIVFLARQNYTPRESIGNINEHYKQGKIKDISLLLNDIKDNRPGYGYGYGYSYGYGYGYGYYEEEGSNGTPFIRKLFKQKRP